MATPTAPTEAKRPYGRVDEIAVALLLIVACVLAPLSVIAVWTKNTLLDTDQYVSTVGPAGQEPGDHRRRRDRDHRRARRRERTSRRRSRTPSRRGPTSSPPAVASSLETVVNRLAVRVLELGSVPDGLGARPTAAPTPRSSTCSPATASRTITTSNGEVAVNLGPVVDRVKKRLDEPRHRRLLGVRAAARQPPARAVPVRTT